MSEWAENSIIYPGDENVRVLVCDCIVHPQGWMIINNRGHIYSTCPNCGEMYMLNSNGLCGSLDPDGSCMFYDPLGGDVKKKLRLPKKFQDEERRRNAEAWRIYQTEEMLRVCDERGRQDGESERPEPKNET